jgi:hypothetical protein
MEHLKSIMGDDYSPSHIRVRAFDNVTQTMFKDKVEPDANGLYWGKPQEIHLKEKCTGTVDIDPTDYRGPPNVEPVMYRGRKNYQFHTIITCKVQIAERRKTTTIKKKKMISRAARAHPLAQVFNAAKGATATGEAAIEERVSTTRWSRRRRRMRRSAMRTIGSPGDDDNDKDGRGGEW